MTVYQRDRDSLPFGQCRQRPPPGAGRPRAVDGAGGLGSTTRRRRKRRVRAPADAKQVRELMLHGSDPVPVLVCPCHRLGGRFPAHFGVVHRRERGACSWRSARRRRPRRSPPFRLPSLSIRTSYNPRGNGSRPHERRFLRWGATVPRMAVASSTSTIDGRPTASATGRSVRRNLILGFNGVSAGRSGRWRLACSSVSDCGASSSVCCVGVAVGGTVVWAAIPGSATGTITACYATSGPLKGLLHVIDYQADPHCPAGQAMLRWQADGMRWRGAWVTDAHLLRGRCRHRRRLGVRRDAYRHPETPPNAIYWALMSSAGAMGPVGATGPAGPVGGTGPRATKALTAHPGPAAHRVRGFPTGE